MALYFCTANIRAEFHIFTAWWTEALIFNTFTIYVPQYRNYYFIDHCSVHTIVTMDITNLKIILTMDN